MKRFAFNISSSHLIFKITLILFSLLLITGITSNPLSSLFIDFSNPNNINSYSSNISFEIDESEFKKDDFWEIIWDISSTNSQKVRRSNQMFLNIKNNKQVYFISDSNSSIVCDNDEYLIEITNITKNRECVNKKDIKNPNIHPLKPLSRIDSNYMILGTIQNNQPDKGIDRLSYLSNSIFQTVKLSFFSLLTFLPFGILFALFIAYYDNRYKFISSICKLIIKSFQCVPILLWILIVIILLGSIKDMDSSTKVSIYFMCFGLFSSPALSNLIVEKINQMKNEDFIVALKLLGLSDMRIIFSHMLKHYCTPIILFQIAYIMAHAFFLDITLCFIEQGSSDYISFGYYIYQSFTNSYFQNNFEFNYLIVLSFITIYIFYYAANYFKEQTS